MGLIRMSTLKQSLVASPFPQAVSCEAECAHLRSVFMTVAKKRVQNAYILSVLKEEQAVTMLG